MAGHDTFVGGSCFCHVCAPPPAVTAAEALRSADSRRARDEQLVAWLRLTPSEGEAFHERLELYDLHAKARSIREATADITAAQLDVELSAFWRDYGEPAPRPTGGAVTAPRIYAPRITAPRAA